MHHFVGVFKVVGWWGYWSIKTTITTVIQVTEIFHRDFCHCSALQGDYRGAINIKFLLSRRWVSINHSKAWPVAKVTRCRSHLIRRDGVWFVVVKCPRTPCLWISVAASSTPSDIWRRSVEIQYPTPQRGTIGVQRQNERYWWRFRDKQIKLRELRELGSLEYDWVRCLQSWRGRQSREPPQITSIPKRPSNVG